MNSADDFATLDAAAHALKDPQDKLNAYLEIVRKAQTDKKFRETINFEKYMNSGRALAHLLPKDKPKLAIYGYKTLDNPWDLSSTTTFMPGSEESTIYASEELVKRGYQVTAYLNPPEQSIWKSPLSNPKWLSEDAFHAVDNKETYDIVLCWRRFDANVAKLRGKKVYFWAHDLNANLPRPMIFPEFDGLLMLTKYHYNQFANAKCTVDVMQNGLIHQVVFDQYVNFTKIPYVISGNGIILEQFKSPMSFTNPYSMGYFSNYARGLSIVLMIWPDIKAEFPEATLDVYYGRSHWGTCHPRIMEYILEKFDQYKDLGVTERGAVGHFQLAEAMQRISCLIYPCTSSGETFSIVCVKAQVSGQIPITTRIAALDETVHAEAPSAERIITEAKIPQFKEKVLETLRRIRDSDPEEIRKERLKYIEFAQQFTWASVVEKWIKFFEQTK